MTGDIRPSTARHDARDRWLDEAAALLDEVDPQPEPTQEDPCPS